MSYSRQFEDTNPPRPSRSSEMGDWGEQLAAAHLISLGYAISEIKWRSGHYEVDIIAHKGQRMVFVEVKTRKSAVANPLDAVDRNKQRRIIRSADVYLRQFPVPFDYQFDIITIVGTPDAYQLTHYPDAFFPLMGR